MPSVDTTRILLVLIVLVAIYTIYYFWIKNEHYTTQKRIQLVNPRLTLRQMQLDPISAYNHNAIIDPLF